jgi:hypothetical protein
MTPPLEEMLRTVQENLSRDPDLARRQQDMHALLQNAQTVAEIATAYRIGCIPDSAKPMQITETEQAMYAACQMLLQVFMRKVDEGGDAAQQWVEAVLKECADYAARRYMAIQAAGCI